MGPSLEDTGGVYIPLGPFSDAARSQRRRINCRHALWKMGSRLLAALAARHAAGLSGMGRAAPHAAQFLFPQTPGGVKPCALKSRRYDHRLHRGVSSASSWTMHARGKRRRRRRYACKSARSLAYVCTALPRLCSIITDNNGMTLEALRALEKGKRKTNIVVPAFSLSCPSDLCGLRKRDSRGNDPDLCMMHCELP